MLQISMPERDTSQADRKIKKMYILLGIPAVAVIWLALTADRSSLIIAVLNGQPSGTKITIDYANRKGIKAVNVLQGENSAI